MGLLDSDGEEPNSKLLRWVITFVLAVALLSLGGWYFLRFQTEKNTVTSFMNALVTGNTEEAYRIWKPVPTYTMQDFLSDWGPSGEFGPVKSFRIAAVNRPASRLKLGASGVIVAVEVRSDTASGARVQEVLLWVEHKNQAISFAP